ncbi:hypothetical protein OIU84_018763 [Salix udensis]|uniref:4-coumarate--CoA ligase n=1 Tax=Salix udensis TaxID=889485 RepID=A0AAD6KX85_9ROSI|nr:hypothetical protein OIU84_018763 [Salix udensis]
MHLTLLSVHGSNQTKHSLPLNMENQPSPLIDPKSGFCSETKTYHSLRPHLHLPPLTSPLSTTEYAFSFLHHSPPPPQTTALLDVVTGHRISFPELIHFTEVLASSLHSRFRLRKGDAAFIISPNSIHIPILYLSLFSLGVVISPSNPVASEPEILHQTNLSKPVIAFVTSQTAHKIPDTVKKTILLDSPEFESLITSQTRGRVDGLERVRVYQSDPAAILYSSGTTGRVKGVLLTHRNFISMLASSMATRGVKKNKITSVTLCTVPYFHVYGFVYCLRVAAMGNTLASMGRFGLKTMLGAIQEYRVSDVALAPPVVVAMVRDVGVMDGYDLSSLETVACGGAPLSKRVLELFKERFPNVPLAQGYGLTETTARIFSTVGPKESEVTGATGKLVSNYQAKIVDPETGESLPPSRPGELWVRGDTIMKGYIGDDKATAATLDSGGWLRTGDLCYIDKEGFLFFVDRIKELIKCKGYQVAPAELEHLLQSNPDIIEAAVIPYPDEEAGQVPVAFVVRQNGRFIDESKIKDFIARQVAPYKRLQRVMFIESLPRNATGKVLRKELINLALSNATSKL